MPDALHPSRRTFDADTQAVLSAQITAAERQVNRVRIALLGVLAVAAALYSVSLSPAINAVNAAVITPLLLFAIGQQYLASQTLRDSRALSQANMVLDVSATTLLLLGYGLAGDPELAVKSPVFGLYFVVLASRPFTGSPRHVAASAILLTTQYLALVAYCVGSGAVPLLGSPEMSASSTGTTIIDEASKLSMLVIAGLISVYNTAWLQRTLHNAISARPSADARFRAVFEQSGVGAALLSESATILEANDAFGELLGVSRAELIGRNAHDFSPTEDAESTLASVGEVIAGVSVSSTTEVRYVRPDGELTWGHLTLTRAEGTNDVRLIAIVQDVTQRKALEKELLRQAFYDPLTGLANRSLFRDRVHHALARTMRDREQIAVMFLDLDDFKAVNDTLGHASGDSLLEVVGARLLNATRGCDTVARLGGDEFAVLLEHVRGEEDAVIVANRVISTLGMPVELASGNTVRVGVSIGIARAIGADGVEELLRNADLAMYAAKSGAPGSYVFFDPSMHTAIVDRVRLEGDLRRAVDQGEFWLAYQPIVALESNAVLGLEALVRWAHPTRGQITPSEFIDLAEETGLIIPIGRWVLREACQRTAGWNARRTDGHRFSVTVNLSVRQLELRALIDDVEAALRDSGLPAELLVLEITENAIMHRTETTLERLRELRALGVRLAIDDFGTGYSSLSYLQQFPVDILKIDQSFTQGLMRGAQDDAFARTIIALGDLLTMSTIAEGVEHAKQHARLRDLGCDYGQGFLFSRPLNDQDVEQLLESGVLALDGETALLLNAAAAANATGAPAPTPEALLASPPCPPPLLAAGVPVGSIPSGGPPPSTE